MEASQLKNMVVLRNLPSNLAEEAIIILKPNQKVKKLETIEKVKQNGKQEKKPVGKEYILKEAEMLVSSYLSKIEKRQEKDSVLEKYKVKQKKIKKYAWMVSIIMVIETILLLAR